MLKGLRQYQRNFGDTIAKPEGTKSRSGIERGYDYKYCRHEAYQHDRRHAQVTRNDGRCYSASYRLDLHAEADSPDRASTSLQILLRLSQRSLKIDPRSIIPLYNIHHAPPTLSSSPVAFLIRPTLLDMFGSSQDRARQLAGRYRNNRKTSGSSYTSSRSVSSSTQLPFQLQTHANLEKKYRYRVVLAKQHHRRLY